jgi:natural product precursor
MIMARTKMLFDHFYKTQKTKQMKKQLKLSCLPQLNAGRKLSLNKKTISNLNSSEMRPLIGGNTGTCWNTCADWCGHSKNCTRNQNTCPGHKTCYYTCV